MDIERINMTLTKAIIGLQGDEIEGMLEAMARGATSYDVPSPSGVRGGYRPPSPASMGFVPKKKKAKRGAGKPRAGWKKGTIEIASDEGTRETSGVIRGVYGVHKSVFSSGWVITHIPSGKAVLAELEGQALAKEMVSVIADEHPELMGEKDTNRLLKHTPFFRGLEGVAKDRRRQKAIERQQRAIERQEKDMAAPASVMGTDKWKKATFNLTSAAGSKKALGFIKGAWGVHKGERDKFGRVWQITHTPSGLRFGYVDTKKDAFLVVDKMTRENPAALYHKKKKFSSRLMKAITDVLVGVRKSRAGVDW